MTTRYGPDIESTPGTNAIWLQLRQSQVNTVAVLKHLRGSHFKGCSCFIKNKILLNIAEKPEVKTNGLSEAVSERAHVCNPPTPDL